jgi:hypothetical protein
VIVHIILFRPRASLGDAERAALATSITADLKGIASVRRVRVGKRVRTGRPYDQLMTEDYSHAAVIEFDDRAAFDAYLAHPVHQGLAARFFDVFAAALFYDYELGEDASALPSAAPDA